jgi:hypothetical protein
MPNTPALLILAVAVLHSLATAGLCRDVESEFHTVDGFDIKFAAAEGSLNVCRKEPKESEWQRVKVPFEESSAETPIRQLRLARWSSHGVVGAAEIESNGKFDYYVLLLGDATGVPPALEHHLVYSSPKRLQILSVDGRVKAGSVLISLGEITTRSGTGIDFDSCVLIFNGCPWHWSASATRVRVLSAE